jgi:tartrate dehydrogenase/decarboxylase/D-malate dehydrogenase
MTRAGVERILRFRVQLARSRPRKKLTVVTKSNAQRHAMVMWDEIAREIAAEFPEVSWDKELVDAATVRMVNKPASLDTIVATNLHADILSDLAAALAGSLGIAPTANLDPERRYPVDVRADPRLGVRHHGAGHREPGRHVLELRDDARAPGRAARRASLMRAIEAITADPALHTRDLGGKATTAEVTRAACAFVASEAGSKERAA